jgi:hypothetical protein
LGKQDGDLLLQQCDDVGRMLGGLIRKTVGRT